MNPTGGADLFAAARGALLDALEVLEPHLDAIVLIGAQAIYLHTEHADQVRVALAVATKDSDLAVDPRLLPPHPLLDEVMTSAGFRRDLTKPQPGTWLAPDGIPVDLMVPEALAGAGGRNARGARIEPHSKYAARGASGLEATVVDHAPMTVRGIAGDDRAYTINVAGPAALLVAKLYKLGERQQASDRMMDKDAHDVYRLLLAVPTDSLATRLRELCRDGVAAAATEQALQFLGGLFADGAEARGSTMAGRAEEGIGDPEVVAAAVSALAEELIEATSMAT